MGNHIISSSFATVGTVLKSSEDASGNYPATNVDLRHRPGRLWKASGVTTSTWVGADLGAATAIVGAFVDNINIGTLIIEADSAATFNTSGGSPEFTTGSQTVSLDVRDGRWKFCLIWSAETYRYWRVRSGVTSTLDGDAAMSVGSVSWITSKAELDHNTMFTVTPERRTSGDSQDSQAIALGPRFCTLTLSQSPVITSELYDQFVPILGTVGLHQPLLFFENNGYSFQAYMVRRVTDVGFEHAGPNHWTLTGGVQLREYE